MKPETQVRRRVRAAVAVGPRPRFKQARAERTYRALLAAATTLFAERGYDGAQTPQIAEAAGVSTGAFYRYFDDKRQIFLEVVKVLLEETVIEVVAELRPERFSVKNAAAARDAIDLVLDVLFARVRRDAPLQRVFLSMSFRDPEVMAMRTRFENLGVDVLARLIEATIPRSSVPNARAAAIVIHAAAIEIAAERAGITPSRSHGTSERAIREALREMVHRYLYPGPRRK